MTRDYAHAALISLKPTWLAEAWGEVRDDHPEVTR